MNTPFWKSKKLDEMSSTEWESLCDGCGRCCLNKLEDWDTGEIYWTNIACSELDCDKCQCSSYDKRFEVVPDCIDLTPDKVAELTWLPPTCAYRLISEGKDLPEWHYLVSGSRETVHEYGVSVRDRVFPEADMKPEEYENHIVRWPGENANPKRINKKR